MQHDDDTRLALLALSLTWLVGYVMGMAAAVVGAWLIG